MAFFHLVPNLRMWDIWVGWEELLTDVFTPCGSYPDSKGIMSWLGRFFLLFLFSVDSFPSSPSHVRLFNDHLWLSAFSGINRKALGILVGYVWSDKATTERKPSVHHSPTRAGEYRVSGINAIRNVLTFLKMISHQKNVLNILDFHIFFILSK